MKKEVLELIKYRLEEAEDSIKEAEVLLKEGMSMRAVMNRLYYAMFYAVLALLQEKGMGTSKHAGAISLFDREFIKKGVFDENSQKYCIVLLNSGKRVIIWNRQKLHKATWMRCCPRQKNLSGK